MAYCRQVAGAAEAGAAAADAFARFRVAVVAAGDTMSLNPEALLISATRTSAAARTHTGAQGDCAAVPALLAARAERTIAAEELERLNSHLEQCWACRAPVERFKAAERAYRDPPEKTVDPALTTQIVAALIAAVPPAPPPEAPSPSPSPSPNDSAEQAAGAPDAPVADHASEHVAAPGTAAEPGDPDASAGATSEPAVTADARSQRRAKGQARGPTTRVAAAIALPRRAPGPSRGAGSGRRR